VWEDIEPDVGERVDMHAILLGHVVPVRVNGECDGEGKKGDNGEGARGAGRPRGFGGLLERATFQTVCTSSTRPGGVLTGSYTMHVRADAASRQNVGNALRSHHT
jgi:hypothetical protein